MGGFIPPTPGLGAGAGRAQWAQKPGGASGIAWSNTWGATMRVPRFRPQTLLRFVLIARFDLRIVSNALHGKSLALFPTQKRMGRETQRPSFREGRRR